MDIAAIDPALTARLPDLVSAAEPRAELRLPEFFVSQIRNPNTRRALAELVKNLRWRRGTSGAHSGCRRS